MNRLNSYLLKLLPLISFIIFYFASFLFAQQKLQIIYFEKNVLPNGKGFDYYLSYRIPYSNLFFVKNGNEFIGGVNLNFELKNLKRIVDRQNVNKTVKVETYERLKSSQDFIEGVVTFHLNDSLYIIQPYLNIINTDNTIKLDSITLFLKKYYKENISHPIVVEQSQNKCGGSSLYKIVNFQNTIPYSTQDYFLLIPMLDSSIGNIRIEIEQEGKIVFETNKIEFLKNNLAIKDCNNIISIVAKDSSQEISYLLLKDFSHKLNEGIVKILISSDKFKKVEFVLGILWFDKPKSLKDPEFAIRLLDIIENEKTVKELLNSDKQDYLKALNKYWDSKLPNRKTSFNNLMYEFYRRADYALENYSTIDNPIGAKSDRGMVYIKYGKPNDVIRDYSNNQVVEFWKYNNISREFIFIDKSGLGNFTLIE